MNLTSAQSQSLLFAGLGVLVVLLTSLIKGNHWSKKTKHFVAVVISALTGVVSSYFQKNGTNNLTDVMKHSTYLYAISQLVYTYALGNTSINTWLTNFNLVPAPAAAQDTTNNQGD